MGRGGLVDWSESLSIICNANWQCDLLLSNQISTCLGHSQCRVRDALLQLQICKARLLLGWPGL